MRIAFSKEKIKLIYDALELYPHDIQNIRLTYELEPSPFEKEEQQQLINECDEKLNFNLKILKKLRKKLEEWK